MFSKEELKILNKAADKERSWRNKVFYSSIIRKKIRRYRSKFLIYRKSNNKHGFPVKIFKKQSMIYPPFFVDNWLVTRAILDVFHSFESMHEGIKGIFSLPRFPQIYAKPTKNGILVELIDKVIFTDDKPRKS